MSRESARAQMVGDGNKTTKSQSVFGAGVMMLILALAAGVVAGMTEKTHGLDGEAEFGIVQFSIFASAGLVSFAVCYAVSVLVRAEQE